MPLSDQARIAAEAARPRLLELWELLQSMRSTVSFMQSGAHPDDETSAMLAALALRDGVQLSYVCSTRGEGGQNDIGTEAGAVLGELRTAEMERAAARLHLRLYWLGQSPDDPIRDFGFSKSGTETLARWGHARTLARFVEVVRTERPDILCPTFLDVPGQHGHHRAMTQLAHEVMQAAADPAFACALPPWQVKKLYLPAWSGAGQAYDDDEPPPPATLVVPGKGSDPMTGWSWERIGQQSRAFHRTQAMGRWVPAGEERDFPLHLAITHVSGSDESLAAGLPRTLADLAPAVPALRSVLEEADRHLAACRAAFPDCSEILPEALAALTALRRIRADCPEAARPDILHRIDRKLAQVSRLICLVSGAEARGTIDADSLRPGDWAALHTETRSGSLVPVLPAGWRLDGGQVAVDPEAALTDPYRDRFDPLDPPLPALALRGDSGGPFAARLPLDHVPAILPDVTAALSPDRVLWNTAAPQESLTIGLSDLRSPGAGTASVTLPEGWRYETGPAALTLLPPADPAPGAYEAAVLLDGVAAASVRTITYPHIAPTALSAPAVLRLRVLRVDLPEVRIGYIGGGNDRVGHWLRAMGCDVASVSDAELGSGDALDRFDTLVVGIFAMRFRTGLRTAMPRLHAWIARGGTLVTLYHRPWDAWDPDTVPPKRLEIGQPSLRWRVTDEAAAVTHLVPDHPLLTGPNRIGPEDWDGWHKERGLYFAKSWDPAYVPLLSMADADEAPLTGALLAADIGKGRHVHTALILHHQMELLVPGAFRLMANLTARR